MKVIKHWKSLPKDVKILRYLNSFNHDQCLSKTILLYAYGIVQDARMTCKFYDLHVVEGQTRFNIVSIITVPSDMRDKKWQSFLMSIELLYLGMRHAKKLRSSSLKVILEKGNSLVPTETIKVLIKNIKIPLGSPQYQ